MVSQQSHYKLPRTPLGVQALLLALLTAQVTSLGVDSAKSRRLSAASGSGDSQITSFCKVYSSNLVCTSCIRDYYLQNNVCVAVPSANRINGCNVYSSNTTCAICDNGRFLSATNTVCQAASAGTNCLAYLNNTACLSCPPGFSLANFVCTPIPNCAQSDGTTCTACNVGYYLTSNATCQQLTSGTSIANCFAYLADGSCARCAAGYVADTNGRACISGALIDNQIDPRCVDQRIQDGTVCSLCRQGYNLVNGRCELVLNSESCLVFDPDRASTCLVCMSGYSMLTLTGACSANSVTNPGIVDPVGSAFLSNFANVLLLVALSVQFG
jgi:hypothetical protein